MAVEAYMDSKDTVRDFDHATREHLKRTGELARREGARLRESLMQNITKSRDILETDRSDAIELGIRSHARMKPQNSRVSQKQMADAVSQDSKQLFEDAISFISFWGIRVRYLDESWQMRSELLSLRFFFPSSQPRENHQLSSLLTTRALASTAWQRAIVSVQ